MDGSEGNVKVAVRCRPPSKKEIGEGSANVFSVCVSFLLLASYYYYSIVPTLTLI